MRFWRVFVNLCAVSVHSEQKCGITRSVALTRALRGAPRMRRDAHGPCRRRGRPGARPSECPPSEYSQNERISTRLHGVLKLETYPARMHGCAVGPRMAARLAPAWRADR
ncbi:hypothetical protein BBSC_1461 [Bifidobacterium scardovii JCM 12489 = DSM 13734]|nr:hypothetical protein BBSC_1461 [Bifidobacterium scardovii JCM 12489 = DSM 13734]